MSKEAFVNRRGKKSQVDTAGVATDLISTPLSDKKAANEPDVKNSKRSLRKIYKKTALILLILILCVVGIAFIAADSSRREFQRQSSLMETSVRDAKQQSISTQTSAYDAARGLESKLPAVETCSSSSIPERIIQNYEPAKQARLECFKTVEKYNRIRKSLQQLVSTTGYLAKQQKVMSSSLRSPSDSMFAEIPVYATTWKNAMKELTAIMPPPEMLKAHTAFTKNVETVGLAWEDLLTASNQQNAEFFISSESNLAKAYENLRASGKDFDTIISSQQRELDSASEMISDPQR